MISIDNVRIEYTPRKLIPLAYRLQSWLQAVITSRIRFAFRSDGGFVSAVSGGRFIDSRTG
jgi:hypothetical protein